VTDRVVIWGASGHALVVADVVRQEGRFEIAGFLDDSDPTRQEATFAGGRVLGGRERLPALRAEGVHAAIVAVGDCAARLRLAEVVRQHGLSLASAVHPRAVVARGVEVGAGTVVCAGAVVNPGAVLGECVIVNTGATVDHECLLRDGVHVGPGAHLGGRVEIGSGTWIGIGAVVSDRIHVGAEAVIGAGAVVVRDIPDRVVAYGVPARAIRPVDARG
jgi:UDP-N-acetylbacillosamine N-acetyltransferase